MSSGKIGVISVPHSIGTDIIAELSERLEGLWSYYDKESIDLGGEYNDAGKLIIDDVCGALLSHFGMPVVFRREWFDYWSAGYNGDTTLDRFALSCNLYEGRMYRFSITNASYALGDLTSKIKKSLRRKRVALEDRWMQEALMTAANSWNTVVGCCSLIVYVSVLDGCMSNEEIEQSTHMQWKDGRFSQSTKK